MYSKLGPNFTLARKKTKQNNQIIIKIKYFFIGHFILDTTLRKKKGFLRYEKNSSITKMHKEI